MLYAIRYFQQPYSDKESVTDRIINGTKYIVNRPNHGVAHSLRQGFLVRDIVKLFIQETQPLSIWLLNELNVDQNFIIKLAILSSFQRSGRQSEVSSSHNPQLYKIYEIQDVRNMITSVDTKYWASKEEIRLWAQALIWDNNNKSQKIINISKLIKAAHLLDLRRIPRFDETRIKNDIANLLNIKSDSYIINKLWDQSGRYLHISGDRDLSLNKTHWSNSFYILQQHPLKLYFKLRHERLK